MTSRIASFAPRRVLLGLRSHAAIADALRKARPDLEYRGALHTDLTADDLAWADTYVGFKRPPTATSMGSVRWVHCTGAGVDVWLAPPALDTSVLLTRTNEPFGPAIAEWVVARIFAWQQGLFALAEAQRAHRWEPRDRPMVAGTRALVVGTGDVGRAIARALTALGVAVTGVSRTGGAPTDASLFTALHRVDALASLVGEADWIVFALPETPETRGLFSGDLMAQCRGAYLLNVGRGCVIDQEALTGAFDNGTLCGAALDVFAVEPLPDESPLWDDPRVVISPHSSGPTTVQGAVASFLACLSDLEQGHIARWVVDRHRGY